MPPLAVPVLEIDAPPVVPASPAMNSEPAAPVAPDATAYVIYTSGSTGTPKGCEISHRNVMRLLFQQRHEQRFDFSFGPGDTWVVAHSLSFDFSVWEIYGALLHGGRLLVPSREAVRDLPEFHALLARHRVSVLNQTPLAFYNLADYEASLETPGLGALRYVVFGGDRLEPARLHPWAAIHPLDRVALVNMYGITETTVHVSFCRLTPEHLAAPGPSPIGRPLAETMVYVVDHHLNPQPAGAPGELVVGGSGVGKGYLNRPELTAERFMPNPFHAGRLYRSGDLGWRTSDGRLFYLGRNDHQVKIRGHRIEPAEIEAALRTLPGVEQAVVLPENGAAGLELSAYVTGAAMLQPLREALAGLLPAHLLPTHLVHCEALPLTAHGKLDRQALRKLREAAVHGDSSDGDRYQPPLGEQEQLLAEVWRGVLGVPRVGRHDRYLGLGGDSIKSIQVLARLRAAGWNLPLKDLFRHPTIAELAPRLLALQRTVNRNDTADDDKPFPLTPIQLRFFAEWPHAERHHFNHAVLLRCAAGTTAEHLRQAVQILADSHGALRLRFIPQASGGWLQRVAPRGEEVVFDSVAVEGTEALARHAEGVQRSLDIEHGPLLRAIHYRLPDGTDRLLLIAHHLCIDGVSWRIVQQDMELLLLQLCLGQPVALPPATDGFSRWSALLRQARGDFLGQLPYWRQMDAAPAMLPPELQAPGRYGDLATAGFALSEAATRDLKQAGRAYQTHLGELLLAAFVRALHQWTGLDTLQLALESHGRDVLEPSDLSRSVGWFTALYPLQLPLAYQSADRQIKEAKEALRRVPQAGLGYGVLRYLGEDNAGLCAQPPVCFNYLGEFDPPTDDALLAPCDGEVGAVVSPDGSRPFALELSASIVGGRFQCSLGFAADQVVPSRRLQLCQTLESELDTLVVHCLDKTATELTPSDLTYKELSLDELDGIFDED
jgi:amino acid adenylation domain-containing protein/non-ribosomal peptide synthase protein (TIGR01720 family)